MTFIKRLLLVVGVLSLVGCSNTPEQAVTNVYDAIKEGDMPKLINNSNYAIRGTFIKTALFECSLDKSKYVNDDLKLVEDCLREQYGNIHVKVVNMQMLSKVEADVNITIQINSRQRNHQLKVAKIDNKWKVVDGK